MAKSLDRSLAGLRPYFMGSEDWLEIAYQEHAPVLFRFLIRLTGNECETKDILQELFVRLAKKPAVLEGVAAPRSYLFRMVHRLAIDHYRNESTRQLREEQARAEQETSALPLPLETDVVWQNKILGDALAALPSEQKAVVLLKVWERMTFMEIATILCISADTAASRYRYAIDKLHRQLRLLERDLK